MQKNSFKELFNWILRNFVLTEKRQLKGWQYQLAQTISGLMAIFYFYTSCFGVFSQESHRGVFLAFTLMLIYLWFPFSKKSPQERFTFFDGLLSFMSLGGGLFFIYDYPKIMARSGEYTTLEIIIGLIMIILVLEGARRAMGALLPLIGIAALIYAHESIAQILPSPFAHKGFDITRIIAFCYASVEGIFGTVDYVLATYVLPFVIFGAFLNKSGVGRFFIELPFSLLGKYPAGTAQVAVVSSALMGTISGSPAANVVSTGTFTIPLMKKAGYRPEIAGAVEAGASTCGMFTPPVMGAAAFFMVEFTGIPYIEIIKIAAIPAFLYLVGIAAMVQIETVKNKIKGVSEDQLPSFRKVFKGGWFLFTPLVLIIVLLIYGFSPHKAAFFSSLSCIVISWFLKDHKMGPKDFWSVMTDAGKDTLSIAGITGVIGIMVGILYLTGLALNLSHIILSLSGGSLLITIFLAAIASFIVGMGAPISATYVILAVIIPPAMEKLGVSVMGAHLLLIWYSQLAGLTPPVCTVAYVASAIAKSDPLKTAIESLKFGVLLLVIPILFIYTPILLTGSFFENILAIITSLLGVLSFVFVIHKYFLRPNTCYEEILFAIGTFLLFTPYLLWNLIGLGSVIIPLLLQIREKTRG